MQWLKVATKLMPREGHADHGPRFGIRLINLDRVDGIEILGDEVLVYQADEDKPYVYRQADVVEVVIDKAEMEYMVSYLGLDDD